MACRGHGFLGRGRADGRGEMSFADEVAGERRASGSLPLPTGSHGMAAVEVVASSDATVATAARGRRCGARRRGEGEARCGEASAAPSAQGKASGGRRPAQGHGRAAERRRLFCTFLRIWRTPDSLPVPVEQRCTEVFLPDNAPRPLLTFRAKSFFTRT